MTEDELVVACEGIVRSIANAYFLPGAEHDDLLQEGRIAVIQAARAYRSDRGASLSSFIAFVVRRKLQEKVMVANRVKHRVLTDALRIARDEYGDVYPISDLLPDPIADTPMRAEIDAQLAAIRRAMLRLSPLEREGLARIANGLPYAGEKTIDNAIARARLKLRAAA